MERSFLRSDSLSSVHIMSSYGPASEKLQKRRSLLMLHHCPKGAFVLNFVSCNGAFFPPSFFFMLAAAADTENDWLFRLVGGLMGFCAALCFAMFGVGFVALWNLWKELVWQLKRAKIGPLLVSSPLAILWLGLGLAVFVMFGMLLEKIEKLAPFWQFPLRKWLLTLVWLSIVTTFYSLWKGRSHAALMLRLILMVSFSTIIVVAVAFSYWWIIRQTALIFVLFLSAIGALNIVFYARWVRLTALKNNLLEPPDLA